MEKWSKKREECNMMFEIKLQSEPIGTELMKSNIQSINNNRQAKINKGGKRIRIL